MSSKFALAVFTLTLSAFLGSATMQEDYGLLPEDADQGDYLASFLVANNSVDSDTPSQTNFRKRNHVMRRMNTGSGAVCDRFFRSIRWPRPHPLLHQSKGIVVPLSKRGVGTHYTGDIRVRDSTFPVAFGTAASDLVVFSEFQCSWFGGTTVNGLEIGVNLFDGSGTGVACQDTPIHVGGISQKSEIVGTLHKYEGFSPYHAGYGCASFSLDGFLHFYCCSIFPLSRSGHSQLQSSSKSLITQIIEEHGIIPVFAFAHRSSPRKKGQGELHLGMIKKDYISSDIERHNCVAESSLWIIEGATITVGKYKIENIRTVFDTASRLVRGPKEEVSKIYQSIKEEKQVDFTEENGIYVTSYETMTKRPPQVTFQWGNRKEWKIPGAR